MAQRRLYMGASAVGALVVAGVLSAPTSGLAGPVALSSADGTTSVTGEYIGFEDNMYIVDTALGELRVSSDKVDCEGASCPVLPSAAIVEDVAAPTASPARPDEARITFAGSDTVAEGLMPLLLEGWAASLDAEVTTTTNDAVAELQASVVADQGFGEPLSEVSVLSTSSSNAFRSLLTGSTDFGMAARTANQAEARALRDVGAGDITDPSQEHLIAVDSLVAIVHPDNPVQVLDITQLRGIFSGQISNWSQVGGSDAPIVVFDRAADSGIRSAFLGSLFDSIPEPLSTVRIATTNGEMSDSIATDPNAIGYVGYAFKRGARLVTFENECGMKIQPDSFSARTEEYDFQRRLYLYNTRRALSPTSQGFLDYVMSTDADEMIEKAGFTSLGVTTRAQDFESSRAQALLQPVTDQFEGSMMRQMLGTMIGYDRLSSTFRFPSGSSQLDRRASVDLARLADYLEEMPAGTQVKFVGFTDDVGSYTYNQDLSESRAAQVMQTMVNFSGDRLDGIQFSSAGFGEISPTACNIDDSGREINRRVEVWISTPSGT